MAWIECPAELTADERLREMASIFAQGVLRRRKCRLMSKNVAPSDEILQKVGLLGLEATGRSPLSVTSGLLPETLKRGER